MPQSQDTRFISIRTQGGVEVCGRCEIAETPLTRMRGLLGRRSLAAGEGVLIRPSNAIHMWFMRFAIDAVFLDHTGNVLRVAENLRPWRMASRRGARSVLEVPAGTCGRLDLREGHRLTLVDHQAAA